MTVHEETWAEKVRAHNARAQSLEMLAAEAKRKGAAVAPQLAEEAKAVREEALAAQPRHERLRRLQERLGQAAEKEAAAAEALRQARQRHEQAQGHARGIRKELAAVEREPAAATESLAPADELAPAVRELLARLERPAGTSEDLEEAVCKLHCLLEKTHPTPAGRLDEALVDDLDLDQRGLKRPKTAEADDFSDDGDDDLLGPGSRPADEGEAEGAPYNGYFVQLLEGPATQGKSDAELGAMARGALAR